MSGRPGHERRFGWLGVWLGVAGGFLAGVLLVAILGGAKPVVQDHARTVAARAEGTRVPRLVGMHVDEATTRLQAVGLQVDTSGGGIFGIFDAGGLTVVHQDPSPGSRLHRGDTVHLDAERS
jgi:PASTA domain-containing protein